MKIEKIDFVTKKERLSSCSEPLVIFEGIIVTVNSKGTLMQASYAITLKEIFSKAKVEYEEDKKLKAEYEELSKT